MEAGPREQIFQETTDMDSLLKDILESGINLVKTTNSLAIKIEEFLANKNHRSRTVISIGKQSLGKSTLLNKIFNCDFPQKTGTLNIKKTVDFTDRVITIPETDFEAFDLIDMEGLDSNEGDNSRDILNITFAFWVANAVIFQIEEKDLGNRHFMERYSYNIWQSLRNLKKNGIETIPFIILFLRNPGCDDPSEKTLEIYETLIQNTVLDLNSLIQKYKEQLLNIIKQTFKFGQNEENQSEIQAFTEIENLNRIEIAKYYVLYHEKDRIQKKDRYLKLEENDFVEWNYEEIKYFIAQQITDTPLKPFPSISGDSNNYFFNFEIKILNQTALNEQYLNQFTILYQDIIFNFYSYFTRPQDYLELFKAFVIYENKIKDIENDTIKSIEMCFRTRVESDFEYKKLEKAKINEQRSKYVEKLNEICSELQFNADKRNRLVLYLIYNYSNQLESKLCLDSQDSNSQVYQVIETIIKFNNPKHNLFQISKLAQIIDQYRVLPYYKTIKWLIRKRINGNFMIKLTILKIFKEKVEISLNRKFQFKEELDTEISHFRLQIYYTTFEKLCKVLKPFLSFNPNEIIEFLNHLKELFESILRDKFNDLPNSFNYSLDEIKEKTALDFRPILYQLYEIDENIYSSTLLERLLPGITGVVLGGYGINFLRLGSKGFSSIVAALTTINTFTISGLAFIGIGIIGLGYTAYKLINKTKETKQIKKVIYPINDYILHISDIEIQKQNIPDENYKELKSEIKNNIFTYEATMTHDLSEFKSAIVKIKITTYSYHKSVKSPDSLFRTENK